MVEPTHLKNMRKSNWIISPSFGVKIKRCLKPPPIHHHIREGISFTSGHFEVTHFYHFRHVKKTWIFFKHRSVTYSSNKNRIPIFGLLILQTQPESTKVWRELHSPSYFHRRVWCRGKPWMGLEANSGLLFGFRYIFRGEIF